MELELTLRLRQLTTAALLLLILNTAAGPVLAQTQDDGAETSNASRAADSTGLLPEPRAIDRGIEFATRFMRSGDGGEVKNGLYPELSNMVTGAGWISGGPGYRHWFAGDRVFVDASAAVSWRAYKMAQARFELTDLARSRIAIGSQVRWQDLTQVTNFGEGPLSVDSDRSEYRLRSANVVGYTTIRPVQRLAISGRVGWLTRPSLSSPVGTFKRGNPSTAEVFPADPVFAVAPQPSYAYQELSVSVDTRDHRGRPTRGAVYRAAWSRYADQDRGPFNFRRGEAEGAQFVPLIGSRLVLAFHGWLVASDTSEGKIVPFYLLPSLGGTNTLRAYSDFRFHDRNLLVVNAEGRLALFTHVDAAVFLDAGNVAPRVGDLDLAKKAVGFGFRMHTERSTFARVDIAHGDEGWRFMFRMNDPLHLTRLTRRTAAMPFVP